MSAVNYSDFSGPIAPTPEAESAPRGTTVGLFHSLQRLLATFIGMVHTRVELLTTELQEEVHRAASLALWALIALFTGLIGVFFGGLTIVFAFWETNRVLAAILVTAGFFVFAAIAIFVLLAKVKSHRRFLEATLSELAKDMTSLRTPHT